MAASLFALRESAVVAAGAGTGKTHSLVTLCLHLLSGAGRPVPLPASRLCAVTFTEKAAAELQSRLRQRIDRLSLGAGADREPELFATCAEAGQAPPSQEQWQRIRRDLGSAQIGTIHSLCAQLLRRHAAAAGLPPSFGVLDEPDSRALLRESCEEAVMEALQGNGERQQAAERLCTELGVRGAGRFGRGLAEELMRLLGVLGETGRPFRSGLDLAAAEADDTAARAATTQAFFKLGGAAKVALARKRTDGNERVVAACTAFFAEAAPALRAAAQGDLAAAWPALAAIDLGRKAGELAGEIGNAKDALQTLVDTDAQLRSARLLADLGTLCDDATARHRERKRRAGALDFDDLTRLAHDLLAHHPRARRAEKQRLGALLVDEFQDTSRAQLALLGWLAEPADDEGTAPAGSGEPGALPIPPGRLVLVGDRKQSIYEFRGADVACAQAFAGRLIQDGALLHHLRTSRRSLPALVAFSNALFDRALAERGEPFHTPFTAGEDDLQAHRQANAEGPCAELIRVAAVGPDAVQVEANAVARRIAQLLKDGSARGGDVAILLRAFTHLDAYRRALLARRIPHLVWQGRGFFGSREVSDLLALLSVAADPDDARSLAIVLRSPLGPISDEALLLLARGPRRGAELGTSHGLRRQVLADEVALAALAPDDAQAVRRLDELLRTMRGAAGRLGPAALLELALDETDFVAACASGLHGEQAAANVEKLLALARAAELRGTGLAGFLARVRDLRDEEAREPDGPVVEEGDPHAVRILTVHAAKGLEFPIVVVPECGASPVPNAEGALALDADLGPALRVAGADGKGPRWGTRGKGVNDRRKRRELAQSRRLFYVAATRARDLVIFSGRLSRSPESWRTWLDALADSPGAASLLRVVEADAIVAPAGLAVRALAERDAVLSAALRDGRLADDEAPPAGWPELEHALKATSGAAGRGAAPATLTIPVTQLADAVLCPRRYQLLHELRLPERPGHPADDDERAAPDPDDPPEASPTELGTLAHKLLERAPFDGSPERRLEALRQIARAEGREPDHPEVAAVIAAAAGLIGSPLGHRLATAKAEHLHRELPFALHVAARPLGPDLLVRGQIDALLLEEGAALVIDYKLAAPHQSARYDLQLDTYGLAVHELVAGQLPVRTALAFLKGPAREVAERPPLDDAGRAALRLRIADAGAAIAQGRAQGRFATIEAASCKALGCGFLARCHGAAAEAEPQIALAAEPKVALDANRRGQLVLPW